MIDWSTVAPAIRSLLSELALSAAVTPSFEGRWTDRKAEFMHPEVQQELVLRVVRVDDVHAHRRYETVTVTPEEGEPYEELRERIEGMREFVLEVRVEAHEHSEEAASWSWSMLERIRTGMCFQRAIDRLLAVNVGIVRVAPSRDISFTFDKRRVNAAMFEVTMNGAFSHADPVPVGWFERVAITSHIRNQGDELLPSPPNVTELVVPPLPEDDESP